MHLIAFFTDLRAGIARAFRVIVASLAISGFAWASQFADSPRVATALKISTIAAIIIAAAHDGKPTDTGAGP